LYLFTFWTTGGGEGETTGGAGTGTGAGSGGFSTTRGGGVNIFGGLFTEGFGIGATGAALRSAGVLSAGAAITG